MLVWQRMLVKEASWHDANDATVEDMENKTWAFNTKEDKTRALQINFYI